MNATKKASSASDGTARPTLDTVTATNSPRPMWPSHRASGTVSRVAAAIATIETAMCVCVSSQSSPGPPMQTPPETDSRSWRMKSNASRKVP
jgi:hypothetical protein